MFKKIALAATMALVASSAAATDTKFYAGLDAGRSSIDDYAGDFTSVGTFAGYRFTPTVALETSLRRLGSEDGAKGDQLAVSAVFTGYAKGEWSRISLFSRIGVNHVNFSDCSFLCLKDETRLVLGIGAGYDFTPNITGRIEYQRPTRDISNVSIGVAFGF